MSILHLYSPACCAICQKETGAFPLCARCSETLTGLRIGQESRCPVCFQLLTSSDCEYCNSRHVFFDSLRGLFPLNEMARELVHRWKFENERKLFQVFVEPVLSVLSGLSIQRIGTIASGRAGRMFRAYEPLNDLARALNQRTGIATGADLGKVRPRRQSSARYEERFFRMPGSLSLTTRISGVKTYLLLEDIFTTGATANESARLLKGAGVESVHVLALFQRQRDGIVWTPSDDLDGGT